jgi:glycyl-tRNA synthetase
MSFPLETIVAWAKRKWFVYPWSQIYGWLANAWDYGPYGSQLKKNIADAWWQFFVTEREDMIGMDTAILAHPRTWDASWHTENFGDFLIDDKKTGQRFRPDKLIEDQIAKHVKKSSEAVVLAELKSSIWVENLIPEARWAEWMKKYFDHYKIKNPDSWAEAERTDIRKFNLMLYTYLGPIHDETNKTWMRPETCQSLFTNFKNICDTTRMRVPFGMAQIGKAFRNEITPGQFLYRTREFEQMEIEYFLPTEGKSVEENIAISKPFFDAWKESSMKFWQEVIQLKDDNLRFREHESDELSHYSKGTFDVEYNYPWGWGELQGIANRGDWDLTRHQEYSQIDMQYKDPKTWARYIPWVIEPSFGLSRTVMAVMMDCYDEETLEDGSSRTVARFPFALAPVKVAILPLIEKDDNMVATGRSIFKTLSQHFKCDFDLGWNIGKRYRRQDEIGTPYCITIDHQTLEDNTVTIRDRDSMKQDRGRIKIDEILQYIHAVKK